MEDWIGPTIPIRPTRPKTRHRPKTRQNKVRVLEGTIENLILRELEAIKEHQRNTNIDLFHIKLDLFKIMDEIKVMKEEMK